MKTLVIDAETGIHNRGEDAIGNMKASPFHPDNTIVWFGHMFNTGDPVTFKSDGSTVLFDGCRHDRWLGHNIGFDILYLFKTNKHFRESVWQDISIWDTMLAEYILSGQVKKYPSLDQIAPKYGGTLKDDRLKDLWDNNIDTEAIDDDIIEPYLQGDLLNTRLVYEGQVKRAKELGMYALILAQMNGLKATIEMEWNGMAFDKAGALEEAKLMRQQANTLEARVTGLMANYFDKSHVPNPASPKDMSLLLYGGKYSITVDAPIYDSQGDPVRYKTGARAGEVKTRKEKKELSMEGFGIKLKPEYKTKKGKPASNEKIMELILRREMLTIGEIGLLKDVLELRQLTKDVSTYYEGYSALVWPDGCLHPSYNHVATDTGRLSCSNPNLQNVSSKE